MTVGRPLNSKTPVWNNTAAVKVRIYRYLHREKATKRNCSKAMNMSRTTVIKWWDAMAWTSADYKNFDAVITWYDQHYNHPCMETCAQELKLPIDCVLLNLATYKEITPKYIRF